MTKTVRELLEEIVPLYDCRTLSSQESYRKRIIDALCDGAEIVYQAQPLCKTLWDTDLIDKHAAMAPTHMAIRLKPQPIKRGVSKQEIVDALRDEDYKRMHAELADKIEREGIVE